MIIGTDVDVHCVGCEPLDEAEASVVAGTSLRGTLYRNTQQLFVLPSECARASDKSSNWEDVFRLELASTFLESHEGPVVFAKTVDEPAKQIVFTLRDDVDALLLADILLEKGHGKGQKVCPEVDRDPAMNCKDDGGKEEAAMDSVAQMGGSISLEDRLPLANLSLNTTDDLEEPPNVGGEQGNMFPVVGDYLDADLLRSFTGWLKDSEDYFLEAVGRRENEMAFFRSSSDERTLSSASESILNAKKLVNCFLKPQWLNQCWHLRKIATDADDQETLTLISEFLIRLLNLGCRMNGQSRFGVEHVQNLLQQFYEFDLSGSVVTTLNGGGAESLDASSAVVPGALPAASSESLVFSLKLRDYIASGTSWTNTFLRSSPPNQPNAGHHPSGGLSADDGSEQPCGGALFEPLCILLADDNFEEFLSAVEVLPKFPRNFPKICHRTFWKTEVKFLGSEILQSCMQSSMKQQLFAAALVLSARIAYARDVCLPRCLDDAAIHRTTLVATAANSYLCRLLQQEKTAFVKLQAALPHNLNVAHLLVQMLRAMKSALPTDRQHFFQALANSNMLLALEGYFNNSCQAVQTWELLAAKSREDRKHKALLPELAFFESSSRYESIHPLTLAAELLYFSAGLHPQNVQQAIVTSALRNPNRISTYWLALANVLRVSEDKGVIIQITEVFKNVLSPNAFTTPMEKGDFVAIFFDKGVFNSLIDILLEDATDSKGKRGTEPPWRDMNIRLFAKAQITSIFRECAHLHQARSRYRFIQCELPNRLVLKAVRYYKIARGNDFGEGAVALLSQTIKFMKYFEVEQGPQAGTRLGNSTEAISSLVSLLLPTSLESLQTQADEFDSSSSEGEEEGETMSVLFAAPGGENVGELKPSEDSSDMSEDGPAGLLPWTTATPTTKKRRFFDTFQEQHDRNDHHQDREQTEGRSHSVSVSTSSVIHFLDHYALDSFIWNRERAEANIIEGAILDLLQTMLTKAGNCKSTVSSIRLLVEKNLNLFKTLTNYYKQKCQIDLFDRLIHVASAVVTSQLTPSLPIPHKHTSKNSGTPSLLHDTSYPTEVSSQDPKPSITVNGAGLIPNLMISPTAITSQTTARPVTIGLLKRGRVRSTIFSSKTQTSFGEKRARGGDPESADESSTPPTTPLSRIQSRLSQIPPPTTFGPLSAPEFHLPSVARQPEPDEEEEKFNRLLHGKHEKQVKSPPLSLPSIKILTQQTNDNPN